MALGVPRIPGTPWVVVALAVGWLLELIRRRRKSWRVECLSVALGRQGPVVHGRPELMD